MFQLLSMHPGPSISIPVAASLADCPVTEAQAALRDLASTGLITEHVPGRYTFHDLVRAYSSEQAEFTETGAQRHSAMRRVLDHYLHTARAADEIRYQARWPITLALVLPKLVEQAAVSGFGAHSWRLAWTIRNFLNACGYHHTLLTSLRTAFNAACRIGDQEGQAYMHVGIGRTCTELRDIREAEKNLEQVLVLFREIGQYANRRCRIRCCSPSYSADPLRQVGDRRTWAVSACGEIPSAVRHITKEKLRF